MEIKLLRAFVCVADTGHFGRAANALCITQPALSKQISALETIVGGRLLERGRNGAVVTLLGKAFLVDARDLVQRAQEVMQRALQSSHGERGYLRVGFGLSTLELAPACIAMFRQRYPDVQLSLNDKSSAEQTRMLLAAELDAGFMRLPTSAGLVSLPLIDERLALVVPEHSPWHSVPTRWEEMNAVGFARLEIHRGPGLAAQIDAWCKAHDKRLRYSQTADDIQTLVALVSSGLACAILPLRSQQLRSHGVRMLPLEGKEAAWKVGLAWRASGNNAVVDRFVEIVQERVAAP